MSTGTTSAAGRAFGPALLERLDTLADLAEELFVLLIRGDDRAVRANYVMGEPVVHL